jgi:hypothetical protein
MRRYQEIAARRVAALLRRFGRDRRGSTSILFALAMPMLIGGLGVGFEISNWYLVQRGMQNAADAAVLAAASNGGTNFDVEATAVAAQFGLVNGVDGVAVTMAQGVTCPTGETTCYRATITKSVPLYLSPALGFAGSGGGKKDLTATAVAKAGTIQRQYCLLALANSGMTNAIRTSGSPAPDLSGCSVKSNTSGNCNGHDLGADYGDAVGTMDDCGKVQNSGVAATADPYAGLAANIPTYSCPGGYGSITSWTGTRNLSGNTVICGELRLTGNVTVNAPSGAVLIIANGRLNTNGFTIRTASGSTLALVFTGTNGGSYLHYPSGSGAIDIAAPTSGPWSGVMMYQDPKLTTGVDITSAGTSPTWRISGLVYLPNASVTLNGSVNKSTYGASCFVLVVDDILIKGSADILPKGGCAAAGLTMPLGSVPGRGQLVY